MKSLDFEWKALNPYHVIVRKKHGDPTQPKMSLQLYQVDTRSYLLDFKSLVDDDSEQTEAGVMSVVGSGPSSRHASISTNTQAQYAQAMKHMNVRTNSLPQPMEVDDVAGGSAATPAGVPLTIDTDQHSPNSLNSSSSSFSALTCKQSQTMHFFEMCASLIGTLAR